MSDIVKLKVRDINKPEPIITEKKTGKKKTVLRWNSGYCPGVHKRYE